MSKIFKQLVQFTDDYKKTEDIILRDHLAMERTKLANERTLLSFIRTSLYLGLGGTAILGMKDLEELENLGYLTIIISAVILLIGIARFYQLRQHLKHLNEPILKVIPEKEEEIPESN